MRLTSLFTALFLLVATSFSQVQQIAVNSAPAPEGYDVITEVVSENIGILIGALGVTDLSGYSTTRVYTMNGQPHDFLSSVSGDATNPTLWRPPRTSITMLWAAGVPTASTACCFRCIPICLRHAGSRLVWKGTPNALGG